MTLIIHIMSKASVHTHEKHLKFLTHVKSGELWGTIATLL